MRLAIMQPYLFPYIGYFQLIHAVDVFVIYDDVNFIKQGWINRNYILVNGKKHCLTLETKGASSYRHINQISVGANQAKIEKTIRQSYCKAPCFSDAFFLFKKILSDPTGNLAGFVAHSIQEISTFLDLNTRFLFSSQIEKDMKLTGSQKVLEICRVLGAATYVNAIGGRSLYNREEFKKKGVDLLFLNTRDITYRQFNGPFVPNLSIIDMLMFNSKKVCAEFLGEYDLGS